MVASDTLDCWDDYTDSGSENDAKNATVGDNSPNINELSDRLRSQKLSEESDRQLVNDLFFGLNKANDEEDEPTDNLFPNNMVKKIALSDPYSQIELKCLKDCETVAKKLSQKIETSHAKSGACEKKLELKDAQTLKRKIDTIIKSKEVVQREKSYSKKKPNEHSSSVNFRDELDILYGDLSDEDEDEPFYYQ